VYTFVATASRSLVANFAAAQSSTVTISTSSNPAAAGTTTGAASYASGASVTVSAAPAAGYAFSNWTENGTVMATTPSYTFVASGNRALVANFTPTSGAATYTVATQSSPAAGGTTSGGGSYASGATATVVATPASGYNFSNWTENGTVVSTTASYSFAATANRTLVANFAAVQTTTYTVGTQSSPAAGGTTSGGGTFASGATVTVMATPASGYNFSNWTENGTVVATTPGYSFAVSANRALVANFTAAQPGSISIVTQSSPPAGGTTSGGGNYAPGANVTVVATPATNYTFSNWTENGAEVSTSASYSFVAGNSNRTLVANFTALPTVTITATANPSSGGSTTGGGTYVKGSSAVTVTATPSPGFEFVNWTENGSVVSTQRSFSVPTTSDRSLVANFAAQPMTVNVFHAVLEQTDSVEIRVGVAGPYPVSSVRAAIGDRSIALTYVASSNYWRGKLSTAGLPYGPLTVVGTATDVQGRGGTGQMQFEHNLRPVVTVTLPGDSSATRNTIQYSATCRDDHPNGCTSLQLLIDNVVVASGTNSLTGTISMVGRPTPSYLVFRGTAPRADQFNGVESSLQVNRLVYTEPLTSYDSVGTTSGPVYDYAFGRALYHRIDTDSAFAVRTFATGLDQAFTLPAGRWLLQGFSSPVGGVFAARDERHSGPERLYELRNGVTTTGPTLSEGQDLYVAGTYLLYRTAAGSLFRRELGTGSEVLIASSGAYTVGANGDVAILGSASGFSQVFRYRNGVVTQVTNNSNSEITYRPSYTDGVNIVMGYSSINVGSGLRIWDGTTETELREYSTTSMNATLGPPLLNGGWTLFRRFNQGEQRLSLRSPTGDGRQLALYAAPEALGSDGTVVFKTESRRYVVTPGGSPRDIGSINGKVVWREGNFYLLLGRTVWRLRP
jgi:hypothetical protein